MLTELKIPKGGEGDPALDQKALYAIGLRHIQERAKRIWTDYNVHDPGITILELLCYALTDLGYRASFPIQDLLASEENNPEEMKRQFFTARQILPGRPLTLPDYRKLLIDLKGVKNAWLRPATVRYYADTVAQKLLPADPNVPGVAEVTLAGLYEVIVEYMDDITTSVERQNVMKEVRGRLHANRNLCEEFVNFIEVETEPFILCAELELAPDADAAKVKAALLFQVQEYLSPPVRNYTLGEMLERKKKDGTSYTADEIFDGPPLDCGFIDSEELEKADLREEIRLSDIVSIIMDIPGIQAVREIVVNPAGTAAPPEDKWRVAVAPGKKPILDPVLSRLVFYKRNMPVAPSGAQVEAYRTALIESARAKAERPVEGDFPIPLGQFRQPAAYYSFQNHFPAVYGIGEAGLSGGADEKRRALALQLKGYLLFFDQVMANYFAQLGRLKALFSSDPGIKQSYFYQVVDSLVDYEKVYGTADPAAVLQGLEEPALHMERRNRFLDHLIARFAERFHDFVQIMSSLFGAGPEEMAGYKSAFLRDYPAISSGRGLGYNHALQADADLWNSANVSGLEKRLAGLLGIRNATRRNLGDIAYDLYAEIDATPDDEFRFRIRKRDTGEIILSSSTRYVTRQAAREEMRRAVHFALLPSGYERKITTGGKHYFNIVDETGEVLARRIEYFDTEAEMEKAIDEVRTYLEAHYSEEGMYLIENILLRPEEPADPFLPICIDPNCTDCSEKDPYSYRIHIILPAESSRFSHIDFRRFAEGVIREETPAHILPKICWIGKEDMAVFEKVYRDWIYLKAGRESADRQEKLKRFIEVLFSVKNVYPSERLRECEPGEEKPKFILGETALGSLTPNDQ